MNRFKELRLKNGFKSQKELADKLFVNQTAVSQWERGATTPSTDMLSTLSKLYNVSIDYLLGREEKKEPSLDEQLEGIDFALFDGARGLDDSQKRAVLKFIKMLREEDD